MKNTLTSEEIAAVTDAWTTIMATNVGNYSSGFLIEYIFSKH